MKNLSIRLILPFLGLLIALVFPSPANAVGVQDLPDPQALLTEIQLSTAPGCACEADKEALVSYANDLATAESLGEAQSLALAQTKLVNRALKMGSRIPAVGGDLAEVQARVRAYEANVLLAQSPQGVAQAFSDFLGDGMADKNVSLDQVKRKRACDMTGGQIILTVIGFLLGIIPGIILLLLLC